MRERYAMCVFLVALAASVGTARSAESATPFQQHPANAFGPASGVSPGPVPGLRPIIVHSQFGGQIFGFDIDSRGTEGILAEAHTLDDGNVLAAVETFDQRTGEIISVVAQTKSQDDFVVLGVVGHSVGLVELEHEVSFLHLRRTFSVLNPLSVNHFTGRWTPPIDEDHIIEAVSRQRDSDVVAVYAYDNSENFQPQVFSANVAAGTFGPVIALTDDNFGTGLIPKLAYNNRTGQAVLGLQTLGNPFVPPKITLVDLRNGETTIFDGVGLGDVNGLAVDSATNIACSTTEIDFSVQFYDLTTQTGFSEFLPNADNQFYSGADVEVDPIHHLFLVAQPNSSTAPGTSSIHVYDEQGTLIESIDGFHFSNAGNVIAAHIAINPQQRFGYVDGPDAGVTQLQAFNY